MATLTEDEFKFDNESTSELSEDLKNGKFFENLQKTSKGIKATRAASITEDTEFAYRNVIEGLRKAIREKQRKMEDQMDLFPNSAISLELAKNFNGDDFVEQDLTLSLDIYRLREKLKIAENRYVYLFGKTI